MSQELPKGWVEVSVRDVALLNHKDINEEDDVECAFVPMALVPTSLTESLKYEAKTWGQCKKGYTQFRDGDLLLAKITPCFENGKSAICRDLPNGIGAGSTEYFVFKSLGIETRYLHAFFNSKKFKDDCTVNMSGSVGHKRVPKDYLLGYPLPLPPLPEQIRIADKLDRLLSSVNNAQSRLDNIPALIKGFRQSVLAAATSGELTREWREQKSVSRESWLVKSVEELTTKCFDGPFGSKLKTADYTDSGVKVARLENIGHLRFLYEKETFISEEKFKTLKSNELLDRDILFSSFVDEEVRTCLFSSDYGRYINKADCFCLRVHEEIVWPEFLVLRLAARETYFVVKEMVHGATRPRINLKSLKSLELNIPGMDEQKEIVRRVESLFALADTVEKQYQDAKARTDRLTQALLAKAFRGELVPQDPNDEPAEQLLERIRQQRGEQTNSKPKRKTRETGTTQSNPERITAMKLTEAPEHNLLTLLTEMGGEADAALLWKKSGLEIDDFYALLKQETTIQDDNASADPSQRKLKVRQ